MNEGRSFQLLYLLRRGLIWLKTPFLELRNEGKLNKKKMVSDSLNFKRSKVRVLGSKSPIPSSLQRSAVIVNWSSHRTDTIRRLSVLNNVNTIVPGVVCGDGV